MTATLQPVLSALKFLPDQQIALVKLLAASGAYGTIPDVHGLLNDRQAQAVLEQVTFDSPRQAADWLQDVTRTHMFREDGKERFEAARRPQMEAARDEILPLLQTLGLIEGHKPPQKHYDHVLVLGAMEEAVKNRLDALGQLAQEGVTFGRVHLVGSQRPLIAEREPIAASLPVPIERTMMDALYVQQGKDWPESLKQAPISGVAVPMNADGTRPGTRELAAAWAAQKHTPGSVLVISNQPYLGYQHEAMCSQLPAGYTVTTVGAGTEAKTLPIHVALDSLARRIEAGRERIEEKLETLTPPTFAKIDSVKLVGVASPEAAQKLQAALNRPKPKLEMLKPSQILADPDTYQFRRDADKNGVTKGYCDQVKQWDDVLHGDPLLVHHRLDGTYYVADGHHRLDLAKRAGEQGPKEVAAYVLCEKDGYTAKDMRIIAAYKNIAHGHCDVMEAAKILKEAKDPQVHQHLLPSLPLDRGNLKQAEALSKLGKEAFAMVERREISPGIAAEVAVRVSDPDRQLRVLHIARERVKEMAPDAPKPAAAEAPKTLSADKVEEMTKDSVASVSRIHEEHMNWPDGRKYTSRKIEMQPSSYLARLEQEKTQPPSESIRRT